jgi:glycerate 2-kinase
MSATDSSRPGLPRLAAVAAQIQAEQPTRLRDALELTQAALEAVDPEAATVRALDGVDLGFEKMAVVALGKAAPAMARGAARALDTSARSILVVTDHDAAVPVGTELIVSSHPVPDGRSLAAGRRLLEVVERSQLPVLFLISGGGSALAEVPAEGLSLADVAATYRAMLHANIGIDEANIVRAHISRIKGGRLAAVTPLPVATILISDVGPHPHLVASGPTLPCTSTPDQALEVIKRHRLDLPAAVVATLSKGIPAPRLAEAPVVMAADGKMAAEAAVEAGRRRGLPTSLLTTSLHGEARTAVRDALIFVHAGEIAVLAGETTVEVRGNGRGGRNQEAALAATTEIAGTPWSVLTFGTDGIDGPTDAAGAYVDGATGQRLRAAGIDVDDALERNDSYSALGAVDALVRIGPTGANVADLWIVDRRDD